MENVIPSKSPLKESTCASNVSDITEGSPRDQNIQPYTNPRKELSPGVALPFGPRMYYQSPDNVVRMKDIGVNRRILLLGVLGSFTPDCWNRHLYLVLKNFDYYQERGVNHICCISTNDPFVHFAWGSELGCNDKILMWSDPTGKYTKALGMDVIVPWLDGKIRSQRYVLLADDMIVTKITRCSKDNSPMKWDCDHMIVRDHMGEEESDSETNINMMNDVVGPV